ncbi:hypothetical protein D3C81_2117630 [compost metagenome]
MRHAENKKLMFLFIKVIFDEPKAYTPNVWINMYRESSPRILGVKIRLFVML